MADFESDSSGTLSSAGGDEDEDENEDYEQITTFPTRESMKQNRRLSTASSTGFYSHYSENGWNDDELGIIGDIDNKSIDDSDEDIEQLDAEQLLEHEHEKLQFFDESLNQCNKLSLKMTGVLQNLQEKLKKLQTTLDPIRKDTTEVATAEKNINQTMNELRQVMEYHHLTTQPLEEIRKKTLKAPSSLNNDKIDDKEFDGDDWSDPFLIWIEKINEARTYFEKNKFKSSEKAIANLKNIAKIAINRMENYFRDLLRQKTQRNKQKKNEIINYTLMDNWKERDTSYPLWTNKLFNRKHKNKYKKEESITDLLYIPYNYVKLLANVALRIEQTANVHKLPDNLGNLVIAPRSELLSDILKALDDKTLLTMMYIHAYFEQAMRNKTNKLFNKTGVRRSISVNNDDDDDNEEKKEEKKQDDENDDEEEKGNKDNAKHVGVLSADALDKLNTMNALDNDPDADMIAIINIDIKKISHPVILYLHISLSLFQLERYLCSTILEKESLLEFDEFFNNVVGNPIRLIIEKIDRVLKVKDIMDVERSAQLNTKTTRRVSFNQTTNFGNPNISIEEAAKQTAKSTAQAALDNDSIHKNMILVKLDLVSTWIKLYPQFDRVLNQSREYGADDDDDRNIINNDDISSSLSARAMIHLSKLGDRLYINCHDSLEQRIEKIKNHKEIKNISNGGGYHPLTIETINLMYGIYEFRDALQHLYDAQKTVSPMMKILVNNSEEDNKNILQKQQIEKTLLQIIKALKYNLRQKSGQYGNNKKTLESIFMINNLHYIVKKISNSDLELVCGQEVLESLRKDINKWKLNYEKATWDKIKDYINIDKLRKDYFTDKTSNLNTKEKKPIKTRYAGFNKEFDEQLNTQKTYSVPDITLRQELINKNIDIVLPIYRKFVNKFKNVQFTKDRGKYHKYDDNTLHEKMQQFFNSN